MNKVLTASVGTMAEASWIRPKGFQISVINAHRTIPLWWFTGWDPLFLEKDNQGIHFMASFLIPSS